MKRKRIIYLVLILVVVAVVVVAMMNGGGVTAVTAPVTESSLRVSVRAEGHTQVTESYVITAPVGGEVERLRWDVGDRVEKGDALFQIRPTPDSEQTRRVAESSYEAALARERQAETLAIDAEAVANQAQQTLERRRALAAEEIITPEMLEDAELAAASAERQRVAAQETLRAASADVESAAAMLISDSEDRLASSTSVSAPVSGRILTIFEPSERVVLPGSPILEMGDLDELELIVDVLSEDAVRIQPGSTVDISEWGGDETLTGVVRLVEPVAFTELSALGVEEQRVNVVIDFDNAPDRLGAGFRVEADIETWYADNVLTAPVSSVFKENDRWFTFVVVADVIEKREIEVGHRSAEHFEIVSGLASGDEVIRYPAAEIEDGVRLKR